MSRIVNRRKPLRFRMWMYIFIRATLLPWIHLSYRLKGVNKPLIKKLKPPYIILGNHVTLWDPVFVNIFINHRIYFVTSETLLRKPLLKWLFSKGGVISKTKALQESTPIRSMKDLLERGKIVCFFPEGRQSWDGVSHKIYDSTAKMLKMMNVPVVIAHGKGSYLSRPRWSFSKRRKDITIEFKKLFEGPELRKMSYDEILAKLESEFNYSEYDFQFKTGKVFPSKKGAEHLEAVINLCPECKSFSRLKSDGNDLFCESCDYHSTWDGTGWLRGSNGKIDQTVEDLYNHQLKHFQEFSITQFKSYQEKPLFQDKVLVQKGGRGELLQPFCDGMLKIFYDRLEIEAKDGTSHVLLFESLRGMHITLINILEFLVDSDVYRVSFYNKFDNAFKYLLAIHCRYPEKTEML